MDNNELTIKSKSKRSRVTLRDVANSLGVSKATVSLAINGSELVAKDTRENVKNKIAELGYVYNRGAAGLSTGETRTVGLAVHDITNLYFSKVCASIEAVFSASNRMSFLCNTNESMQRQAKFINALGEYNADGLILCPSVGTSAEDIMPLLNRQIPVVLIARDIESANVDFIGNDDELAIRLATDHLIRLGHRRIAMLGGGNMTSVGKMRRAGFVNAHTQANIEVNPELMINCEPTSTGGVDAIKKVMRIKNPPTALACFNDRVALGALSELYERGFKPGEDIAVIGCDGIGEGGRAYVGLSTVNVQKAKIGQVAAETLLRRLDNPKLKVQRVILEPKLVIRKSCGANK